MTIINTKYYRHYKGSLYQVLSDHVLHTETGELLTIYRRISDNAIFARPSVMFHGFLEDGTKRFVEVLPDIKVTQGSEVKEIQKGTWAEKVRNKLEGSDKGTINFDKQSIERHK